MARLALLSLLTLACSGLCASAQQETLQTALGPGDWSWKDCGDPSYPVHIKSIEIYPDPPQPGEDLTVKVIGETTETIEDGAYADVSVKVGAIKILQKEFDICEEAAKADAELQCPVEKGSHTVTHTVALPKEIPRAPFKVGVQGYTIEDEEMVCLNIEIDFRKGRFFW